MQLLQRFSKQFRKMSLRRIISLSFTAVTITGMLFLGLSLILRYSLASNKQARETSQMLLEQVDINVENHLRRMMRVSDTIYYVSVKSTNFSEESIDDDLNLLYDENRDIVVSISLFNEGGGLISSSPLTMLKPSVVVNQQSWFTAALDKMENFHFSVPHVQNLFEDSSDTYRWVISLSRQVQLTTNGQTEGGVLLVDMSFAGIEQICREVSFSNDGYLYLMDSSGEMIYHPQQQMIYAGLVEENNSVAAEYADGTHTEKFNGETRQITVKTVGYTGWRLVAVVPAGSGTSNTQILAFSIFLMLFTLFMLIFMNSHLSAMISDPIQNLEQAVQAIEAGVRDVEIAEGGCYEVEHLGRSIRSMVSTMHHLMDDVIAQERQKRRSELDVLQSQINPHFLYNTLDSVIWMTEAGQNQEAIEMVTSLARFFRISLSKGKSVIPIEDELEHARYYMNIQEIRYKNKFKTEIVLDESAKGLYTIKLIVQPILENSIYHGFASGVDEGLIRVHAYVEEETLIIDVSDNGIGMPPQVAAQLLSRHRPDVSAKGSGIGVRNVHQRIALSFGAEYGLTIFSEADEGTLVRITLPVLTEPKEEEI